MAAYPVPTMEQIRSSILTDWLNEDPQTDVTTDSDNYIRATGMASAILGLYQYATWGINQFFPDSADLDYLARFAAVRGITQIPATNAYGTIQFTGQVGASIPIDTVGVANGVQYQTTAAGTIGATGTATIAAAAVVAGTNGNQPNNTAITLQSAPAGIDASAILLTMSEGYAAETQSAFLGRVLQFLQHPPAGGNKYDYQRWASTVAGVTSAVAYPLRRGPGTIDICIMTNGAPATAQLLATVTAYINQFSPAGADFMVITPTLVPVPVTAQVALTSATTLAAVESSVLATLTAYFATLTPGVSAGQTSILAAFTDLPGVTDVKLTTPTASVPTLVNATNMQLATLGTVTITLMGNT
jgi:uncharacterized phage protein gp47/JayE